MVQISHVSNVLLRMRYKYCGLRAVHLGKVTMRGERDFKRMNLTRPCPDIISSFLDALFSHSNQRLYWVSILQFIFSLNPVPSWPLLYFQLFRPRNWSVLVIYISLHIISRIIYILTKNTDCPDEHSRAQNKRLNKSDLTKNSSNVYILHLSCIGLRFT